MKNLLRSLRDLFLKPSVRIGLGVLVTGGFIAGVLAWQGFNTAMEATNKEEFCLSCHTMHDNLLPELQKTVHWNNRSGVRARCPDCHVPHDFTDKVARKMQASREVLGQLLGTIDTREKFKEHRIVLAQREWKRFAANGSKECRACHDYKDMNFDKMR
ncbi:MAG: NapC/NirT family cytochrome c, partial [Proteobacteria bacterium]|nr:NapC/NirT family cytochrome c [Pseudomonadota bacterium]